jgi:LmbE family N-acetylglucosaminyl deacetylase
VYLTNGDHNQFAFIVYEKRITLKKREFVHMGEVRRLEAIRAMQLLGLNEKNLIFLGYPDFGTFTIFSQYWQTTKPFRDLLTRISYVPYKENLSFGAPYVAESILRDLRNVLLDYKPHKIFVSHAADVNVDHKSLYLFLQIALADLKGKIPQPKVYPYLVHCVGWPLPRHYHPELSLGPPKKFLDTQMNWRKFELTQEQLNKKYQATLCYKSQTESSAFYLFAFARKNELFGDYPEVELTPPEPKSATAKQAAAPWRQRIGLFFGSSNLFTSSEGYLPEGLEDNIEGKGRVSYSILDDNLLIRIDKAEELTRRFSVVFYLFGYSSKTPFAAMPKIRIFARNNKIIRVFDGKKRLPCEEIALESNRKELIIKIPLKILGEPDFLLASLKTSKGVSPVEAAGFRKINIRRQ